MLRGQSHYRLLSDLDFLDFQTRGNGAILQDPMEEGVDVPDILVESYPLDLATPIQNELVQRVLVDPFGGIRSRQPFKVPQRQHAFVDGRLLQSLDLLGLAVFLYHLVPVGSDNARKHVRIQLRVLDLTEVLGQSLARQCLSPLLASFIPPDPPSLDVLSLVDPYAFLMVPVVSVVLAGEGE